MCIAKMQVRVERLYKHNTMDDVIYIRGILDELYEETDQVLKRLKHAYQGSDKEWDNLEDNLDEIKNSRTVSCSMFQQMNVFHRIKSLPMKRKR